MSVYNSTKTYSLIIVNNLGHKIFGAENTFLCVMGLNEDYFMRCISFIGQLVIDRICCTKIHLVNNLGVSAFMFIKYGSFMVHYLYICAPSVSLDPTRD